MNDFILIVTVLGGLSLILQILKVRKRHQKASTRSKRSDEYRAYLRSPEWQELRKQTLDRDNHRCRTCNSGSNLEVHHRYYPDQLGTETVDALTTLCRSCHKLFEWKKQK